MELLGSLSVLLASFSVLSEMVAFAESPQPPILSLHPQHPIYTQGEEVTLICSAPAGLPLAGYTFYEERGDQVLEVKPKSHNNTFRLDGTTVGTFHCVYQILESGMEIQSPKSSSVSVTRTESPQPPVLSLRPQLPVYVQGEEVALTCSAPKGLGLAGYALYEETGGQTLNLKLSQSNTFKLNGKTAGRHSCTYWTLVSGRKIQSQRSNSIFLAWRDPLPPPVLEVNPPLRAVYEGEPLLISCLSGSSNTEKRFHFYRDGDEMDSSNADSLRSSREPGVPSTDAALRIPQFNSSHSGEFACSYEENMNGRWVPSPWSQKVNITVQLRDSSVPVLMYVRLALVLLIPMVSLVYYCHQRRKRDSSSQEAFQPQETEFVNHGMFKPQIAALQLQTETRLKRLETVEEDVRYSEIEDQPTHRPKPGEVGRVSYREIQFQPIHKTTK